MNDNLRKYLAICLGVSMFVYRASIALGNIFTILSILIFLCLLYQYRKNEVNLLYYLSDDIKCNQKLLIVLIVSMIPNIIFSFDVKDSMKCFFEMWVYRLVPFFMITAFVKDKVILLKMLLMFLVAVSIESVYVIYKVFNSYMELGFFYRHAATGFGHNVMYLSAILSMIFPIVCVLIADKNYSGKTKVLSFVVGIFMLACIVVTQTRGLWFSLMIVCPFMLYKFILESKKNIAIFLVVIASIVGFFINTPQFTNRLKSITDIHTDSSNNSRIMIWESSINMIKDYPITGVGLDCFKRVYDKEYKRDIEKEKGYDLPHTHNNFLQIFTEAGIFGFLGFFSFTVFMLWSNFKAWIKTRNPYALMLFGVWSAFTLFGMIDNTIDGSAASKALWYLTGLLVALKSDYKEETK